MFWWYLLHIIDYFSKYGFGDGEYRVLDFAEYMQNDVVEVLNWEFKSRGLPYRAHGHNIATAHNPIRMSLQWVENGKEMWWEYGGCLESAYDRGDRHWGRIVSDESFPDGAKPVLLQAERYFERLRKKRKKEWRNIKKEERIKILRETGY